MKQLVMWIAVFFVVFSGSAVAEPPPRPERVLFVGNSLTYYGNVPALYAALAEANGYSVESDMIVEGGATLAQRVDDGSVADALAGGRYTVVVLQERGGDLICAFGPSSCEESRAAIDALARLARSHGARVVMLGTYQPGAEVSRELVDEEARVAERAGIGHAEVSESLRALRKAAPDLIWAAEDGMHPGRDLALLHAIRVYQALHGALPRPAALHVSAPIYGAESGLDAQLRTSDAAAPRPGTPDGIDYSAETAGRVLGLLGSYAFD